MSNEKPFIDVLLVGFSTRVTLPRSGFVQRLPCGTRPWPRPAHAGRATDTPLPAEVVRFVLGLRSACSARDERPGQAQNLNTISKTPGLGLSRSSTVVTKSNHRKVQFRSNQHMSMGRQNQYTSNYRKQVVPCRSDPDSKKNKESNPDTIGVIIH